MMRQVAFLLMILASASGFLKKPRVSLTLYQQFVNFSTKHIMVDRMPVGKCFNVLKEKRINQEGQKCKKINTFIHAPLEDVVKCNHGNKIVNNNNCRPPVREYCLPDSEMKVLSPVDSGDLVDVECSVQMDAQCFEEHMVWWFGSGPDYGLVWTEKNSSAQCDSSPAPQTCFYTFPKTLNASDSGSLHCAVAACGRVLFGNATKVIVKDSEMKVLSPVDSGDSVDVECSVQMDAQCFEEHMVWIWTGLWFGLD
uniref:Ig-like domain-containing protein n=1 Tax=Knipowitschia caucasica TaxID=637954 RepID=A0AAV2MHG6_KNICA